MISAATLALVGEFPAVDLTAPVNDLKHTPDVSHNEWATAIAKRIARWRGFGPNTQERADVIAFALFTLARKAQHFTPRAEYGPGENAHGHFRGWIHMSLRAECLRECKRLRGGGTFHTPPKDRDVIVSELPARAGEDGIEEIDIADHREPSPDFHEACRSFSAKSRWDTDTGEPTDVAEPPLTRRVSRKLFALLKEIDPDGTL